MCDQPDKKFILQAPITTFILLKIVTLLIFGISGLLVTSAFADSTIPVGRYTSIVAGATAAQINPLAAVVKFHFPPSVQTVGDAVSMLLANTGFRLAPVTQLSTQVQNTLGLPLPITDRTLGFISIADALKIFMGQTVYRLQVNPLLRTVNFSLSPLFQPAIAVPAPHVMSSPVVNAKEKVA